MCGAMFITITCTIHSTVVSNSMNLSRMRLFGHDLLVVNVRVRQKCVTSFKRSSCTEHTYIQLSV